MSGTSILCQVLRYADRPQSHGELMDDAASLLERQEKRINLAIAELTAMIDGGEECRGRDSELSRIINILESGSPIR